MKRGGKMPFKTGVRASLQKRAAIYRRHIDGQSPESIAEEFGISIRSVRNMVSRLAMNDERVMAVLKHEKRLEQLGWYDNAVGELTNAWEKSKQLSETVEETGTDGNGNDAESYESIKKRKTNGEVKYLTEARHIHQAVAEMLGLNEPKTQINQNINAHHVQVVETIVVSREDIARVREEQKAIEDKTNAATNAT